jgi:hypothetical protein|tara:strand:+ start:2011 stop:2328 length:318 start_codon:yes stop_codon:yes gene_type:complete
MSDKIYVKLIPNKARTANNQPSWIAPINPKSPEGKTWRIGAKIGDAWYSQAAFDDVTEDGNLTGGINVVLTPNDSKPSSSGGGQDNFAPQNKGFGNKTSYGNKSI